MRRHSVALFILVAALAACAPTPAGPSDRTARILTGAPTSLDPAVQGDAGSAAISAQLFESLTTFDSDLHLQPALAESWQFEPGGRRVTFQMRPGLTFSDGSPLRASDVVRSWLRLIDPRSPSPLASLALDIAGAEAYLRGQATGQASVGLHADDSAGTLTVDLVRPASDFPTIVSGPTFAVVPPAVGTDPAALDPGPSFVASGGYVLSGTTATGLTLKANPQYWAGQPAIGTIELVGDLGGRSEVDAFQANELDYAPLNAADAAWIAYDQTLGPQLREVGSLSTEYYGFDTSRPPFDDVRVRRAIAAAVDWRRLATLAGSSGTIEVANSMVPPGIPGRSDADFLPAYNPAAARKLLADAGYPDGAGFPATTLMTSGGPFDQADRRRRQARARDQLVLRVDGRRLLRSAGHRSAPDVGARLGCRLSGPERLPGRPARDGRVGELWSVELRPVRRGHRGGRLGDRSGRDLGRLRQGRIDRARRCAGHPGRLRAGLGVVPDGPAGRHPERARDRPDGRVGMGRLTARLAVLGLAAAISLGVAPAATAASWATFGTPTARSTYGTGVEFSQPVTIDKPVARVELLLTVADAIGPTVVVLAAPGGTGATTLSHLLATTGDAHLLPNTPIVARWRLVASDDPADTILGPALRVTYADDRFTWQTESGSLVRVHWYNGSADFGRRALKVGEDGVSKAADLFGVTESKPVDFYVYADQRAFYDALGPGTRENVGGEADASIRTLFALIPPGQIDDAWVGIVIPHELTHLVIDTAAGNPYHFLPRWLNEGLAVYESQGDDASDRGLVSDAVSAGTLIPLEGLVGQFPTSSDGFYLAYAESVSAVDFLFRTYGTDALVSLVKSYKAGRTDDEAFQQGLGVDTASFGAAWLASLGANPPERYGPQPAPAGPVPSAWLAGGPAAPTASAIGRSPGASTPAPAAPSPASGNGGDATMLVVVVLAVAIGTGLLGLVAVRRGRRRSIDGP